MNTHKTGYKTFKNIDDRYISFIDQSKQSKKSKEILWDWVNERRANALKDTTTIGLLGTIINIVEGLNKDLLLIKGKDGKNYLQDFFKNNNFKVTQELWYKKCLKRFWYWLSNYKEDPSFLVAVNWINTKQLSSKCSLESKKKREDNLLSPEEVRKMIAKATLLRDKLAISLLADTGIRAESVGASKNQRSISIKQIEFKKGYAIIRDIQEKFGKKRDIVVTESLSYLIKVFNEHPFKDDPNAPLFLTYSSNRMNQRWGYSGLKDMLHNVSKLAISRIVNPHDFRHLKATRLYLDDNLSDEAKMKLMGWSSRRMLDTYTHIDFNGAKDEYLAKKGIITIDKDKKKVEAVILKPKECLVCRHINSTTDAICENCGNSLDYENMVKEFTSKENEKALIIINEATKKNPKIIKEIAKTIMKIYLKKKR